MKNTDRGRLVSLCLLGSLFLASCTARQPLWLSPTASEIKELRARTVPDDGSLNQMLEPIRTNRDVRASWEFRTKLDSPAYFQWLKTRLDPSYHATSETANGITFVKSLEGDSYTLTLRTAGAAGETVVEVQFVAGPD